MRYFALCLLLILLLASNATHSFGAPRTVSYAAQSRQPGTIEVRQSERALYFVLGGGRAVRYPVAVPKKG